MMTVTSPIFFNKQKIPEHVKTMLLFFQFSNFTFIHGFPLPPGGVHGRPPAAWRGILRHRRRGDATQCATGVSSLGTNINLLDFGSSFSIYIYIIIHTHIYIYYIILYYFILFYIILYYIILFYYIILYYIILYIIYIYIYRLVVWNMNFMTSHMLGISSSQLTFTHSFQRCRYTTNQ